MAEGNREVGLPVANLAFGGGKTNRQISDKAPSQYFPPFNEKSGAPFEMPCIPTAQSLLGVEKYKEFLRERRAVIAKRLNDFLAE